MSNNLQEFFAAATTKAAADLEAALLRLPEDKRAWSPGEKARTALDQVAECAMLNGSTAEVIQNRVFPADFDFPTFLTAKAELAKDWNTLHALFKENTTRAVAAIQALPEADLGVEIAMPWGPMTLAQIISYPYWNMSYHEGQINYIASLLG